jgi:hypothetical protein
MFNVAQAMSQYRPEALTNNCYARPPVSMDFKKSLFDLVAESFSISSSIASI